ncbi:hypothetical protein SAMN04489732_110180 [Amycolatopsis saalfeldensis]|uniref:Uncharacterized protein n=1 Tax=Amycolatopsis saalfeldensis TaxID=394193 RepID=A0A1H8Y1C6_9PSEU|nr:hypothetical protein SAMN04489732_110180 [Amycolatopsis saalfeldensis]
MVGKLLSVGYGVFSNAKSGNRGDIVRDGVLEAWDLCPGSAYAFAYAGLRPTDPRPVTGPADVWLRLPDRDYWAVS